MRENSKNILESLMVKIPEMRNIYSLLDLPVLSSSQHLENNSIVNYFSKPSVVICNGLIVSCLIIEKKAKNKFYCIEIKQEVTFCKCNKGDIKQKVINVLKEKDFIPSPLFKRLLLVDDYSSKEVTGEFYTSVNNSDKLIKGNFINAFDFINNDFKQTYFAGDVIKDFLTEMDF